MVASRIVLEISDEDVRRIALEVVRQLRVINPPQPAGPPVPEFLSEPEAAALFRVQPHVLRDARHRGEIQAAKVGRKLRYRRSDLDQFFAGRATTGRPTPPEPPPAPGPITSRLLAPTAGRQNQADQTPAKTSDEPEIPPALKLMRSFKRQDK